MTEPLPQDQVTANLIAFIRERFLDGDPQGELTETTPLLEWGILNSLNTAVLIGHVREKLGAAIPASKVTATTFRDVRSISAMLSDAGRTA